MRDVKSFNGSSTQNGVNNLNGDVISGLEHLLAAENWRFALTDKWKKDACILRPVHAMQ